MNTIFYENPVLRDLSQMPVFYYESELNFSAEDKLNMITKLVSFLDTKGIVVSFSDYVYDPSISKEWETKNPFRPVPIAELMGAEIVINPREIDFLSVLLSIAHIYGHLVQRSTPKRYKGITDFLHMFKPLSIERLQVKYREYFNEEYKREAPSEYVGDYKSDFLQYEIEAFAYARHTFSEAGIEVTEELEKAMMVYLRTDYEELWRWASESPVKEAKSFMDLFQKNWNSLDGWEQYALGENKEVSIEVKPDPEGRLTVVRDGYEIPDVYL